MTQSRDDTGFKFTIPGASYLKRLAIVGSIVLAVTLVLFLLLWNAFFVYVPPGKHLVIISKDGAPLTPGEVLADPGQKGVQRVVLGEGWHFVLPILYTTEREDNTVVPAGKVGIVTALGGKPLPSGRLLAEPRAEGKQGEQGIQRHVLPPGMYRINLRGYKVELVDAVEVRPGYVGVLRRMLGKDGGGRFAEEPDEKGILREILQPGLYYINTKEFEVIRTEIGIVQTSFHYESNPANSTAITFTSKGGFAVSMDCTIEWEVLPENMPALVAEYGGWQAVERNVIEVQAKAIGRDRGIDYGAQDFLEGSKREKFQDDFTKQLVKVCKEKNVTVHSAFIRNIVIPESYLKPIRDKQIAAETETTNKAKEATAQSEAEVEREQQLIQQRVLEVQADTTRLVASIDREVGNTETKNLAEIEKLKAEYDAQIAALDAERTRVSGEAEATVTRLKETAKSSLYQMKMEVFQNDGNAYLRYSMAQQMNPKMMLRLFHSGPGTFWTNMDGKGTNLLISPIGGDKTSPRGNGDKPAATPEKK